MISDMISQGSEWVLAKKSYNFSNEFRIDLCIRCAELLSEMALPSFHTLKVYKIQNPHNLGHAVIINNVASEYPGSKKEMDELVKLYRMMNFQVHIHNDCDDSVSHICLKNLFMSK